MKTRRSLIALVLTALLLASSIIPGQVFVSPTVYAADSTYEDTAEQQDAASSSADSTYGDAAAEQQDNASGSGYGNGEPIVHTDAVEQGTYLIDPGKDSRLNFLTDNGGELYNSTERRKVLWKIRSVPNNQGYYCIQNFNNYYLTLNDDDSVNCQYSDTAYDKQLWQVIKYGDGTVKFIPYLKKDMALKFTYGDSETSKLSVDKDNDYDCQFFKMDYCSEDYFCITCHDQYKPEVYRAELTNEGSIAFRNANDNTSGGYWSLLKADGRCYKLINLLTGQALASDDSGRVIKVPVDGNDKRQLWYMNKAGGCRYDLIPLNYPDTPEFAQPVSLYCVNKLPENVALKKPAIASFYNTGFEPSCGNDGRLSTSWNGGSALKEYYWQVDLKNYYKIEGIQLYEFMFKYDYSVFTSLDSTKWDMVAEHKGKENEGVVRTEFIPTAARYVKVKISKPSEAWYPVVVREFMVFGVPTNAAALKKPSVTIRATDEIASRGNDGNTATIWTSDRIAINDTWRVDLQGLYWIDSSWIQWYGGSDAIFKYEIFASVDKSNWTAVVDKSNNTNSKRVQIDKWKTPVKARYVLVLITGLPNGYKAGFSEFRVSTFGDLSNLALGKNAVASSSINGNDASGVTAGDGEITRWESSASDPQWIYVDLGAEKRISMVKLYWEAAYAKDYKLQISNDASNWTDVYTMTNGKGGWEEIDFDPVNARYVRMYGTQRGTEWAYSMYEFQVYYSDAVNLALGKNAVASSSIKRNVALGVTAGDGGTTRWESRASDPQWIYVDLGAEKKISRVKLYWEAAYAKDYKLQISNDASNWTDVYTRTNGKGGWEEIDFDPVNARYVRMYGTQRGTRWAYSMNEFQVFN